MPLLYRYFRTGYLETLDNCELRVARIRDLNDPFECKIAIVGEMTPENAKALLTERKDRGTLLHGIQQKYPNLRTRRALERHFTQHSEEYAQNLILAEPRLKERIERVNSDVLEKDIRVVCFSANQKDDRNTVLLWSHYANEHKGVRIGFDVPSDVMTQCFRKIEYSDNRVFLNLTENAESEAGKEQIARSLRTKSSSWAYEEEIRMLVHPGECYGKTVVGKSMEFVKLPRSWVRFVDFGVNAPECDISKVREMVKARGYEAVLRQAKTHATKFCLLFNPISGG